MNEPNFEPLMPDPIRRKAHSMLVDRNLRPTKDEMKSEKELAVFIDVVNMFIDRTSNPEDKAMWQAYLNTLKKG